MKSLDILQASMCELEQMIRMRKTTSNGLKVKTGALQTGNLANLMEEAVSILTRMETTLNGKMAPVIKAMWMHILV